ncbi:hypothetical protein [Sphingomonas sp. Root710]|nr:hypothetical protein [Sphingomonas sp. Root710]
MLNLFQHPLIRTGMIWKGRGVATLYLWIRPCRPVDAETSSA